MFQDLLARMSGRAPAAKKPDSNVKDDKNKQGDANDPNNFKNKEGDANDTSKQSQKNPLDIFDGLFTIQDKDGTATPPAFSLDPESLTKIASSLDFVGQMQPELVEKLKTGDPETLKTTLNSLGQNAYVTLMRHLPALTEKYVNARLEHSQKGLGKSVKQTLTQQALNKIAADNPVLKQQAEIISGFLLEKYPDADPDWLAEQTGEFFVQTAKVLKPDLFKSDEDLQPGTTKQDTSDVTQRPGFDWGTYIGSTPSASPKK